jgi:anti-sigma regulatory factor (Ser/Thr protein kinase)
MVTNSIIHGNHEDINKKVVLHIDFTTEYITVEIQDEGSGIKELPTKEESQELDYIAENGRGLKLAVLICDDIVLKGNKITLMFSRNTTQS